MGEPREQRMNSPGPNEIEIWRPIEDFPDYEVSSFGKVRSCKIQGSPWLKGPWRILSLKGKSGYKKDYIHVHLYQGKSKKKLCVKFYIHTLVARAFIGPAPTPSHVVNHDDLNKENNYYGNLEWVTKSEDWKHAFKAGRTLGHTDSKGEKNVHAKLTEEQVLEIRRIWKESSKYSKRIRMNTTRIMTQKDIAEKFNVSEHLIQRVCIRETWKHI